MAELFPARRTGGFPAQADEQAREKLPNTSIETFLAEESPRPRGLARADRIRRARGRCRQRAAGPFRGNEAAEDSFVAPKRKMGWEAHKQQWKEAKEEAAPMLDSHERDGGDLRPTPPDPRSETVQPARRVASQARGSPVAH